MPANHPRLRFLTHYHQAPGRHPRPRLIPRGTELVELVTGGRGWIEEGGTWHEVTPGALLWHVAGEFTIARSDFENPYRCLAVDFTVSPRSTQAGRPAPRRTAWADPEEVNRFAREAMRAFLDDSFDRAVLGDYLRHRLLFQARLHGHRASPENLPAGLRRVLRMIDRDFAVPLPLARLAGEAGWSTAHLHEVARERLGQTPHQLLIARRLRAARERLAASRDPIKQIAVECGFGSAAAFCHVFRAHTATTPAAYREEQWRAFGG